MTTPRRWEFWIDIGGTFTDCVARRPDGELRRAKVLSSGAAKGVVCDTPEHGRLHDPARIAEAHEAWRGCRVHLLDDEGRPNWSATITGSDGGLGYLDCDAEPPAGAIGRAYEIEGRWTAPTLAIRQVLGLASDATPPPIRLRLATTRGTNALLTRSGARTAFVTTRGFADLLQIGYQDRPRLFDLAPRPREELYSAAIEIDERVTADGEVLAAPLRAVVMEQFARLRSQGVTSIAVCLMNAYALGAHELLLGQWAREAGFDEISLSHQIAARRRIVPRADATVLDAYLKPVLRGYLAQLREELPDAEIQLLTSAGGLTSVELFRGADSILSGPAGGVVGASRLAAATGRRRVLAFDMGGTSTDVARLDGRLEREFETVKAGVRVVAPLLAIETIAAGGGSVCRFDGVRLLVGPESAGADPGPACYGRGGPLTVTDLNVLLGRVPVEQFPFPLNPVAARRRLDELREQLAEAGQAYEPDALAAGLLEIANAHMVRAIASISTAKGRDPREYALCSFGGAGGQHACAVADELGVDEVLIHPDAGLLSAWGAGLADVVRIAESGVYIPLSVDAAEAIESQFQALEKEVERTLLEENYPREAIKFQRQAELRYAGLDAAIEAPFKDLAQAVAAFQAEHRRLYGYDRPEAQIEAAVLRVEGVVPTDVETPASMETRGQAAAPHGAARAFFGGAWREAATYDRKRLVPGDELHGPAIVSEATGTTVVEPGWSAAVLSQRELVLRRQGASAATAKAKARDAFDPVQLELFNNRFAAAAEQMGVVLRNTASSVNVKERLDFSCALFTAEGDLVVNAPHIPVHLGAMSETIRALLARGVAMAPGDAFIVNDPFWGGSHLPDVTIVSPQFDAAGESLRYFAASRAHHAEIGGVAPGSMPPNSRRLCEEGVLFRGERAAVAGRLQEQALFEAFSSGEYPSRDPATNLADVRAQIAANGRGAEQLDALIERFTWPVVEQQMQAIQTAAAAKAREAIRRLPDGERVFVDHLDDGSPIQVRATVAGDELALDFAGSAPVHPGNLNATPAIVRAAVLYVLRCLVGEEIPLNEGLLAPVTIHLPPGILNPPAEGRPDELPAVAGGNVETSQRIVDVLLGALGLAAASGGSMNNVLFGDASFGYYETICGGVGATPQSDGASAMHMHMTNTRITDPETMEARYPVRLHEFSIRRGSGGVGVRHGGDGVRRRIEFLRPLDVSLLTQRRGPYAPYGMEGGQPGAVGVNTLISVEGVRQKLPSVVQLRASPGEILEIETPGGGGWGATGDVSVEGS